ncbi:MAG: protein translocase subunit SecD [Pseudomonadota bacterium]
MSQFPRWKIILIALICLGGVVISLPNFLSSNSLKKMPNWFPKQTMNLGLDLRGGSHLLLEVDFPYYLREQVENLRENLRKDLRKERIGYTNLKVINDKIVFGLRDQDLLIKTQKLLKRNQDTNISIENNVFSISFTAEYMQEIKKKLLDQSREIIRRRVDETGTKEPIIQSHGDDKILLQVPGLEDPEHLKNLLGKTAKMTFHLVNENVSTTGTIPFDTIMLDYEEERNGQQMKIPVFKKVMLTGDLLTNAMVSYNQFSRPVVAFEFNHMGSRQFAEITKQNIGRRLAIVLDDKVICAPTVTEAIIGGSGNISGNYTVQSANDLALLLRAGALPAPLKVIEERTVGPSLGAVSIAEGKMASIISVLAVVIFMVMIYGLFGIFANIALCFNLTLLVAILSLLQATLTLPGIAGIVLTMGMSVDANVLIFERIREECKNGLSSLAALDRGFNQAFNTIVDSNLTTILVAVFLYSFGSGAVKGFSVTLMIGIATSMFSAITLTKLMMSVFVYKYRPKNIA